MRARYRIRLQPSTPDGFKKTERIEERLLEHLQKKIAQTGPWDTIKWDPNFYRGFMKIIMTTVAPSTTLPTKQTSRITETPTSKENETVATTGKANITKTTPSPVFTKVTDAIDITESATLLTTSARDNISMTSTEASLKTTIGNQTVLDVNTTKADRAVSTVKDVVSTELVTDISPETVEETTTDIYGTTDIPLWNDTGLLFETTTVSETPEINLTTVVDDKVPQTLSTQHDLKDISTLSPQPDNFTTAAQQEHRTDINASTEDTTHTTVEIPMTQENQTAISDSVKPMEVQTEATKDTFVTRETTTSTELDKIATQTEPIQMVTETHLHTTRVVEESSDVFNATSPSTTEIKFMSNTTTSDMKNQTVTTHSTVSTQAEVFETSTLKTETISTPTYATTTNESHVSDTKTIQPEATIGMKIVKELSTDEPTSTVHDHDIQKTTIVTDTLLVNVSDAVDERGLAEKATETPLKSQTSIMTTPFKVLTPDIMPNDTIEVTTKTDISAVLEESTTPVHTQKSTITTTETQTTPAKEILRQITTEIITSPLPAAAETHQLPEVHSTVRALPTTTSSIVASMTEMPTVVSEEKLTTLNITQTLKERKTTEAITATTKIPVIEETEIPIEMGIAIQETNKTITTMATDFITAQNESFTDMFMDYYFSTEDSILNDSTTQSAADSDLTKSETKIMTSIPTSTKKESHIESSTMSSIPERIDLISTPESILIIEKQPLTSEELIITNENDTGVSVDVLPFLPFPDLTIETAKFLEHTEPTTKRKEETTSPFTTKTQQNITMPSSARPKVVDTSPLTSSKEEAVNVTGMSEGTTKTVGTKATVEQTTTMFVELPTQKAPSTLHEPSPISLDQTKSSTITESKLMTSAPALSTITAGVAVTAAGKQDANTTLMQIGDTQTEIQSVLVDTEKTTASIQIVSVEDLSKLTNVHVTTPPSIPPKHTGVITDTAQETTQLILDKVQETSMKTTDTVTTLEQTTQEKGSSIETTIIKDSTAQSTADKLLSTTAESIPEIRRETSTVKPTTQSLDDVITQTKHHMHTETAEPKLKEQTQLHTTMKSSETLVNDTEQVSATEQATSPKTQVTTSILETTTKTKLQTETKSSRPLIEKIQTNDTLSQLTTTFQPITDAKVSDFIKVADKTTFSPDLEKSKGTKTSSPPTTSTTSLELGMEETGTPTQSLFQTSRLASTTLSVAGTVATETSIKPSELNVSVIPTDRKVATEALDKTTQTTAPPQKSKLTSHTDISAQANQTEAITQSSTSIAKKDIVSLVTEIITTHINVTGAVNQTREGLTTNTPTTQTTTIVHETTESMQVSHQNATQPSGSDASTYSVREATTSFEDYNETSTYYGNYSDYTEFADASLVINDTFSDATTLHTIIVKDITLGSPDVVVEASNKTIAEYLKPVPIIELQGLREDNVSTEQLTTLNVTGKPLPVNLTESAFDSTAENQTGPPGSTLKQPETKTLNTTLILDKENITEHVLPLPNDITAHALPLPDDSIPSEAATVKIVSIDSKEIVNTSAKPSVPITETSTWTVFNASKSDNDTSMLVDITKDNLTEDVITLTDENISITKATANMSSEDVRETVIATAEPSRPLVSTSTWTVSNTSKSDNATLIPLDIPKDNINEQILTVTDDGISITEAIANISSDDVKEIVIATTKPSQSLVKSLNLTVSNVSQTADDTLLAQGVAIKISNATLNISSVDIVDIVNATTQHTTSESVTVNATVLHVINVTAKTDNDTSEPMSVVSISNLTHISSQNLTEIPLNKTDLTQNETTIVSASKGSVDNETIVEPLLEEETVPDISVVGESLQNLTATETSQFEMGDYSNYTTGAYNDTYFADYETATYAYNETATYAYNETATYAYNETTTLSNSTFA